MFHHIRSAMTLSLIVAFVITGCRFNPQAAQKVAERSRATAQAANAGKAAEAKADTVVATVASSVPVQAVATKSPVTSAPAAEPTAIVAAQPAAPANVAPVASKALLPAVSNAAVSAPVAVVASAADAPAAAPASANVTLPKKIVRPVVRTQPKVVSQRPKRTQARVVRPKVTVVRKAPMVRRSLARVGCVIASNISVNRRKGSSLSAGILGRVAPRTRFVALARSKTGRWLFGVSRGRTGWVATSTLNCGADTRRLTVRAR